MARDASVDTDAVVIPLTRERPRTADIPAQRTTPPAIEGQRGEDAASSTVHPGVRVQEAATLRHDLSVQIMGLESPERFFSGVLHALWMSAAFFALIVFLLMSTGLIG